MRFRNGLALFERTNSKRHWNLASFHSPHSLTWRWILSLSVRRPRLGRPVVWFKRNHRFLYFAMGCPWLFLIRANRDNGGWQWGVEVLGVHISRAAQQPMWFRDLYYRMRDEQDFAAGRLYRGSAYKPPPPLPTVTAQNTSVH